MPACRSDPRHADSLPGVFTLFDHPNHLMSQNDGQLWFYAPFDFIQLGVTNSAGCDSDQHFAFIYFRLRKINGRKRRRVLREQRGFSQEHGFHCDYLGGSVSANSTPSLTHVLNWLSVLQPSASTISQPFIGLPAISNGRV